MSRAKLPRALTIAGFDPSGGAGVLADVKTFGEFGLDGFAAITSITFQDTTSVFGAVHQSGEAVRAQVRPLLDDGRIVCSKTGMLPTREVVLAVVRLFRESDLPRPVVDPVILSSSGERLMEESALAAVIDELLPLARLVTPNTPEAERLTGITISSEVDMLKAAAVIREMGAGAVLIKGGHLRMQNAGGREHEAASSKRATGTEESQNRSEEAVDVLDDQGKVTVFRERRVTGGELHGSGCILSAAIAAGLGKGMTLEHSVCAAKTFVLEAIRKASDRS